MKLYNIPEGSRIKAETSNESGKLGDFIIYDHKDGMYGYMTIEGKPEEYCNLYMGQELKLTKEGYYELI